MCWDIVVFIIAALNIFMVRHAMLVMLFAPYSSNFISCDYPCNPGFILTQLSPILSCFSMLSLFIFTLTIACQWTADSLPLSFRK